MCKLKNLTANIELTSSQYYLITSFNFEQSDLDIIWLGIAVQQGLSAKKINSVEYIDKKIYKINYDRVN